MNTPRLIGDKFTPRNTEYQERNIDKIQRVVRFFALEIKEECDRRDLIGNVHAITKELIEKNIYEDDDYLWLINEEDLIRESL